MKDQKIVYEIITIDGPAGSGKSTVSRLLARKLGFIYLDTGAMYRAVALKAERENISLNDPKGLENLCDSLNLHFKTDKDGNRLFIGNEDISLAIRTPEMDMLSSRISAVKEVREALTRLQRSIGEKGKIVAEGRDMGTVVFPEARFKFFVTASSEVRAKRRYKERIDRGDPVTFEDVAKKLNLRDEQDMSRSIAPLKPARDAEIIDTTNRTPDQVVNAMQETMESRDVRNR